MQEALVELVPRLFRHALLLTKNKNDADDLVQETIEKALRNQNQWQLNTHLDRWVFTIQNSIWKNELRWRSYRRHEGESYFDEPMNKHDNSLERTLLLTQVFNQVMALVEDQREAMLLVYVEGFKYKDAADILNIPLGTLMSRLARARLILAKKLGAN